MRLDLRRASAVSLIATLPACGSGGAEANNAAHVPFQVQSRAPTPLEAARTAIMQQLGREQAMAFENTQEFTSQNLTIVCGQVRVNGGSAQRFVVVGGQDAFVESQMQPGHMDQAVTEFCRNA